MDLLAQFALMSKATSVFSNEETFLSFPVTPLAYPKAEFDFSSADVKKIVEFSMVANMIPKGILWDPTAEVFLWDIYGRILHDAQFAFSARTNIEEASYRLAQGVLAVKKPDGTFGDSPQLLSYHTHQSLYENAVQEYTAQASTAVAQTDPEAIRQWTEVKEPALRAEVVRTKDAWETSGYKEQVETARSVIESLGAKSPLVTRAEWLRHFNQDIDTLTRPEDQQAVFPTTIAPAGALLDSSWLPFELSGTEIAQLIAEAPAEVKARLGSDLSAGSLESIRFEFSSAKLLRPWFRSDVFKANFWRFDDDLVLSDGGTPPKGACPSYAIAVVFARNITVKSRPSGPRVRDFAGFHILKDLPLMLQQMEVQKIPVAKERVDRSAKARLGLMLDLPKTEPAAAEPTAGQATPLKDLIRGRGAIDFPGFSAAPTKKNASGLAGKLKDQLRGRSVLEGLTPQLVTDVKPEPAVEPPAELITETEQDNIHILAFICKPIPRCPNPDPALQW